MKKNNEFRQERKWWFRFMKSLMTKRYPKPEFRYLGEHFQPGSIILSNHEGTDSPMTMELYCDIPIRFWGASEMNSGLVSMYKYQSRVYYHEKKHWNLHLARLFCLIASPLTNLFYKGLNLISTYHDVRFVKTLRESVDAIEKGQSIVIFPEDSTNGYLDQLEGFHGGFVSLCDALKRKGIDVPVYCTFFKKKEGVYVVDRPVLYSEISRGTHSREEVAKKLLDRTNELSRGEYEKKSVMVS